MCADASVCVCVSAYYVDQHAHTDMRASGRMRTHREKHPHYVDQHVLFCPATLYMCVAYYCMCVLIPAPPAGAAPGFVVHRNDSLESRLSALTSHVSQVLLYYICYICALILCMRRLACVQQA